MTRARQKQENKEYILNKLSPEYVSIYRIELNSGRYEILRLSDNTNAKMIVGNDENHFPTFDAFTKEYADTFIKENDKEEFLDWFCCRNMKNQLRKEEKITYHYQSVSKDGVHRFYEAYAVKGYIDEEKFNVFLAFRNVDSILYKENETSHSKFEGAGLGLALAKKLADRLGGNIAIESKKGEGTTVTITLTFKIGEPEEIIEPEPKEQASLEGLCALVVEDNELNMVSTLREVL